MSVIEFNNISKEFVEGHKVIKELNLSVEKGEFVTILGPSGCGKTTLLKMVNKLELPTEGEIFVEGKKISEWDKIELRRNIGYVIQQIGLFPHMTILDNISFVLALKNEDKAVKKSRAIELLSLVGLDESMLYRYPRELSGGQKQRVGVARALASDPDIILMDEPFGAVDEIARTRLQDKLKEIQLKLGKTILFVTHDIEEAFKLGTKIVLMNKGVIEQVGSEEELIYNPKSDFVKEFLGLKAFISILDEKHISDMYNVELEKYINN